MKYYSVGIGRESVSSCQADIFLLKRAISSHSACTEVRIRTLNRSWPEVLRGCAWLNIKQGLSMEERSKGGETSKVRHPLWND